MMAEVNQTNIKPTTKNATTQLSTGGTSTGSQWGAGAKPGDGFVWHGDGPAPEMTKDQILADMGFMSKLGGWNPDGGGVLDANQSASQTSQSSSSSLSNIGQVGGSNQDAAAAGANTMPTISSLAEQDRQLSLGGAPAGTSTATGTPTAGEPNPNFQWGQGDPASYPAQPTDGLFSKMTEAQWRVAHDLIGSGLSEEEIAAIWNPYWADQQAQGQAGTNGGNYGNVGSTPGNVSGGTNTGTGPNGGAAVSPGGQTGVGSDNANLNFTDQGDGVYRGWKSSGPAPAVNETQADGSVQGKFQDTRGNEFRGEFVGAEAMGPMAVEDAQAASAAANNRDVNTSKEYSSAQLNDILSQDSPLMQLARQDGINMANNRGLMNSSLAAGASMAEMARQASPLAQQQAEAERQAAAQNQTLESSRLEQNAGREQQTNLFNADEQNTATSQEFGTEAQRRLANSGLETQTNLTNAGMANDLLNSDRQRTMSYNLQQLAGDQDYAKQKLASDRAIDLANIEGQYKMLISENDTAARMFDSTYKSIADIMGNDKIYADEASAKVNYLIQNMEAMMETLLAFESFDFTVAGSTGSGKNSDFNA